VTDAVATARRAGVIVRMVTGDNIQTAKAIARQCGILTEGGVAVEGPALRRMTPAQLDAILPDLQASRVRPLVFAEVASASARHLSVAAVVNITSPHFIARLDVDDIAQVVARASPEDKYLLVTRLNGYGMPKDKEEWAAKHADKVGVTWEADRDRLLPGYKEEWDLAHPGGGQVVGVTGDGTNDAPALKVRPLSILRLSNLYLTPSPIPI
jgi:magnesium-transporting ATPase (P-type)